MAGYKLRHVMLKLGLGIALLLVFTILVEFVFFYSMLTRTWKPKSVDLIAVFAGARYRVAKGYELANECLAPYFTISPRSSGQLKILDERFKKENCYESLIETHAQTTFQNALLVGRIVREEKLTSVLLVTTAVHMPRSYLLLRLQLLGKGATIIPAPVEQEEFAKPLLQWSVKQKKRVYNEMVELWGSLIEVALFEVSGQLSEESLKKSKMVSYLRSVLLFEV